MKLQDKIDALPDDIFVGGPREHFEARGRLQLITLLRLGLYPDSKVLDIGCGCLRAGYWLIQFLNPGCFAGIEPNRQMLQVGLDHVLDAEMIEQKRPRFDHNDRFDASPFGMKFDFFVARSIWTHAAKVHIEAMLDAFVEHSEPDGMFIASYKPTDAFLQEDYEGTEWVGISHESGKPGMVGHSTEWIQRAAAARGLVAEQLPIDFVQQVWITIRRADVDRRSDARLADLRTQMYFDPEQVKRQVKERRAKRRSQRRNAR